MRKSETQTNDRRICVGRVRLFGTLSLAAALVASTHLVPAVAGPAVLFDPIDGRVMYAEDQDDLWHPASLTKIMTAYLTFEALKTGKITLETKIATSELANSQPPSKIGLPVGAEMTVDLALRALIIKSANDVAVMLAEHIGGSQEAFVERMNATSKRLGMSRTLFVNPNGLPAPEQVTTARDLGRLARAVLKEFPEYASLWSMVDMQVGRRRLRTHNGLLKTYEGADGLKTGFICDSGYNVVASATREGRKLVAVVLGAPSGRDRSLRAASMLEHGFQFGGWSALFKAPSLETMPISADARSVTSVRDTVTAWDCGGRRRRAPAAIAKVKKKRQELAKQAAGAVSGQPAAASAKPAPVRNGATAAPAPPAAAKAVN
jgi:D-alanyl-D-alanine carboxypeptidase